MLIDTPPTLLNTTMHNKHLRHLMAKSMNELAYKSPLILSASGFPVIIKFQPATCNLQPAKHTCRAILARRGNDRR